MTKKLTPAQIRRMEKLIMQRSMAQAELDGFVAYLREEHDAPENAWTLYNIQDGFVQGGQKSGDNE